jgi:hypothetical protein
MADQIFIKFGMMVMPLEASQNLFFLISYNVMDAQSPEVGQ